MKFFRLFVIPTTLLIIVIATQSRSCAAQDTEREEYEEEDPDKNEPDTFSFPNPWWQVPGAPQSFVMSEQTTTTTITPAPESDFSGRTLLGADDVGGRSLTTTRQCGKSKWPLEKIQSHIFSFTIQRIIGGGPALENNWPWQVQLIKNGLAICGSSLINDQWIITAAHCFAAGKDPSTWKAGLGKHLRALGESGEILAEIGEIIIHPGYKPPSYNNDIALVKLARPLDRFTDKIKPVCLPRSMEGIENNKRCIVSGWGFTKKVGVISQELKEVELPITDHRLCESNNAPMHGLLTNNMFCAGLPGGGEDSCKGDSGGPMICHDATTDSWKLTGVVSWGRSCAQENRPGVYVDVSRYIDWIEGVIPKPTTPKPQTRPVVSTGYRCGLTPFDNRLAPVYNRHYALAVEAYPGGWPWQAFISRSGKYQCGGTLITNRHVITAAQCFRRHARDKSVERLDMFKVTFGKQKDEVTSPGEQTFGVANIRVHEEYRKTMSTSRSHDNDIAIVTLDSPMNFDRFHVPACLPKTAPISGKPEACYTTGYGKVTNAGPRGFMKQAQVPLVSDKVCRMHPRIKRHLTANMVCAGHEEGGQDSCIGDRGSPLVCEATISGSYVLQGIVSWGVGKCGLPKNPAMYTKVFNYVAWIKQHTEGFNFQ